MKNFITGKGRKLIMIVLICLTLMGIAGIFLFLFSLQ